MFSVFNLKMLSLVFHVIRMLVAIARDEWPDGRTNHLTVQISDENHRPVMEAKIDCAITIFDTAAKRNAGASR